jgi:putative SOS response-associated peptidase YedK
MCGRYVSPDEAALERAWNITRAGNPFRTVFNAAPTMALPVNRMCDGQRVLDALQWGLVPSWWSKTQLPHSTINARAEDAATKPMWRGAVRHTRCLVPCLGWYEWKAAAVAQGKRPYFIHRSDRQMFCLAGLWSAWQPQDTEPLRTFAILTREAVGAMAELHDRMPLVLPQEAWASWLDANEKDGSAVVAAALAAAETAFEWYPVSTYVNSPRNQGEACWAPAA